MNRNYHEQLWNSFNPVFKEYAFGELRIFKDGMQQWHFYKAPEEVELERYRRHIHRKGKTKHPKKSYDWRFVLRVGNEAYPKVLAGPFKSFRAAFMFLRMGGLAGLLPED